MLFNCQNTTELELNVFFYLKNEGRAGPGRIIFDIKCFFFLHVYFILTDSPHKAELHNSSARGRQLPVEVFGKAGNKHHSVVLFSCLRCTL